MNRHKKIKIKMKKKILLTIMLFISVFTFVSSIRVFAGPSDNAIDYLWGGSEEVADGLINGNESGLGWASMNNISSGDAFAYGVNIPSDGSPASGYAWSENVGWISFNPADVSDSNCPLSPAPCQSAHLNTATNKIEGWARIVSIKDALVIGNSGGWKGYIALGGAGVLDPGVSVSNIATGELSGYALSATDVPSLGTINYELGWIDFSKAKLTGLTPPVPPTVTLSAGPNPIILSPTKNLPQAVDLTWTVTDATSCTAVSTNGSWSGAISPSNGAYSVSVPVGTTSVTFTLDCNGPGGNDSGIVTVLVGCQNKACGVGDVCDTGAFVSTSTYTCNQECTMDSQCVSSPLAPSKYREVAPN